VKYGEGNMSASVELDHSDAPQFPNKDFHLLFRNDSVNKPKAIINYSTIDPSSPYCAYLTFFPEFNEAPIDDA